VYGDERENCCAGAAHRLQRQKIKKGANSMGEFARIYGGIYTVLLIFV